MRGCTCAIKYDAETNRYTCSVTGGECFFLIPNSKRCAEEFGEGPDA